MKRLLLLFSLAVFLVACQIGEVNRWRLVERPLVEPLNQAEIGQLAAAVTTLLVELAPPAATTLSLQLQGAGQVTFDAVKTALSAAGFGVSAAELPPPAIKVRCVLHVRPDKLILLLALDGRQVSTVISRAPGSGWNALVAILQAEELHE